VKRVDLVNLALCARGFFTGLLSFTPAVAMDASKEYTLYTGCQCTVNVTLHLNLNVCSGQALLKLYQPIRL